MRSPERVAHQYYAYNAAFNATRALYLSTYALFLADTLHIAATAIPWLMALNLIFTMLGDIPAGAFADLWSRRTAFLWACGLTSAGYLIYALSPAAPPDRRFLLAVGAEFFLAVGFTFYSGVLDAWVVDLQPEVTRDTLYRIFAAGQLTKNVVYALSGVAGAALYFSRPSWWVVTPYLPAAAVCGGLLLHAAWAMAPDRRPGGEGGTARVGGARYVQQIAGSVRYAGGHPRLVLLIVGASASFLLLQVLVYFWPYYLSHEVTGASAPASDRDLAVTVATAWAFSYGARAAGNAIAAWPQVRQSPAAGITVALAINTVPVLFLGVVSRWAPLLGGQRVVLAVCAGAYATVRFGEGLGDPLRQVLLNLQIPSERRATLLSVSSTFSMIVSAAGLIGVSAAIQGGVRISGLWLCAGALTLMTIPLYWLSLRTRRPTHEHLASQPG